MTRPTISIAATVKNEAAQMTDFILGLIDFADEIIIVDSGSGDNTRQIVANAINGNDGNKIKLYDLPFDEEFHYGKAKNFAIEKATKDFTIVLDADERLSAEFKENIHGFLERENPTVASVTRIDYPVHHLIESHERIIKNGRMIFYGVEQEDRLHEHLRHNFAVKNFLPPIMHKQGANHWLARPQRMLFQMGIEIDCIPKTKSFFGHFLRGIWAFGFKFKKVYFRQRVYKDGWTGLKFAFLRAFYVFLVQIFVGLKPKK